LSVQPHKQKEKTMKNHCRSKLVLVTLLSVSLLATGCSAQWISVALADLPVLTQMALNLAALVSTLQSGKQLNPAEAAAIQTISAEATKDLTLLQSLYSSYKANPSPDTLQKIQTVIQGVNQNLPALLQAAHISHAALSTRITAAVNLIVTTVGTFAASIPPSVASATAGSATSGPAAARVARQRTGQQKAPRPNAASPKPVIPGPNDLKKQWNQQVCAPSGNAECGAQ
jgi:hypothetical protein